MAPSFHMEGSMEKRRGRPPREGKPMRIVWPREKIDGKPYQKGQIVYVTEDQRRQLLSMGSAVDA